jgi:hypothetical protein
MYMRRVKTLSIPLAGLAILLFCVSCVPTLSTKTELRLGTNEKWSAKIITVLAGQDLLTKSGFEQLLKQESSAALAQGIQASWQQITDQSNSSNLTYQIKLSGTGYGSLNQMLFNGEQALARGASADQVVFNLSPFGSFFETGQQNTFTLIAGKILTANGSITKNTTVTWINPSTTMRATASTKSSLNMTALILAGIGLFVIVVIGIAISRRASARKSIHEQETPIDLSNVDILYCMNCGRQIPPKAVFCPNCGQRTT